MYFDIGLHDADNTKYPNLALMKISAWYKANGLSVGWFNNIDIFGCVFSSKVFTFTVCDDMLPDDCIKGGTGYSMTSTLDDSIEHTCPDYSIYGWTGRSSDVLCIDIER